MSDPWLTCQNSPAISLYFASLRTQRGISQRLKLRSSVWYHGSSLGEEIRLFKLLWSWQRRLRQRVRLRLAELRDWSRMQEIILLKRIWCIRRAGMRMLSWRMQVFFIFWHVWGRTEESFINSGCEREHQRGAGTTNAEIWTASNFFETLTGLRYQDYRGHRGTQENFSSRYDVSNVEIKMRIISIPVHPGDSLYFTCFDCLANQTSLYYISCVSYNE